MAANSAGGTGPQYASVSVPPGDYAAVGKAEARNGSLNSGNPGFAVCTLSASDDYVQDTSSTSVVNDGAVNGPASVGAATLSNTMAFHLPQGGTIDEYCNTSSYSEASSLVFQNITVVATQVGQTHR